MTLDALATIAHAERYVPVLYRAVDGNWRVRPVETETVKPRLLEVVR